MTCKVLSACKLFSADLMTKNLGGGGSDSFVRLPEQNRFTGSILSRNKHIMTCFRQIHRCQLFLACLGSHLSKSSVTERFDVTFTRKIYCRIVGASTELKRVMRSFGRVAYLVNIFYIDLYYDYNYKKDFKRLWNHVEFQNFIFSVKIKLEMSSF